MNKELIDECFYPGVTCMNPMNVIEILLEPIMTENKRKKLLGRIALTFLTSHSPEITEEMKSIKGLNQKQIAFLSCIYELASRMVYKRKTNIVNPRDILPYIRYYSLKEQEHFISVLLNGVSEIIEIKVVAVGTVNRALLHPRDVFFPCIEKKASSLILCHNHPSGICTPSDEDIKTTKILKEGASILGIPLVDHIIFSSTDYFSFVENNLVFTE